MKHGITPTHAEIALSIIAAGLIIATGLLLIYLIHGWGRLDHDDHHDVED